MRILTIEQPVYNYQDLLLAENSELKQKVIKKFTDGNDYTYIWDEARQTVEKFNWAFDLKDGNRSWLDFNTNCSNNAYQYDLKGLRLRKFLINNYYQYIYESKIYRDKLWYINDKKAEKKSKLFVHKDCVLTGVCYDMSILQPVYNFIEKYDSSMSETTFESLMNDCYGELRKDIDNEIDYRESDEGIMEEISGRDYEFDEYGNII